MFLLQDSQNEQPSFALNKDKKQKDQLNFEQTLKNIFSIFSFVIQQCACSHFKIN